MREDILLPLLLLVCRLASISSRIECIVSVSFQCMSMMAKSVHQSSVDLIADLAGTASACGSFENDILSFNENMRNGGFEQEGGDIVSKFAQRHRRANIDFSIFVVT